MRRLLASTAIVAFSAVPALASDLTGAYVGGQIGYGDVGLSDGLSGGDNATYGLHAGYNYDFGDWLIGGELEYDWTGIDIVGGAVEIENVLRLKARAGYDFGGYAAYVVGGAARAYTDNLNDDDGWLAGVGVMGELAPNWVVSGELLYHEFDDFDGSSVDVDATTFNLRASFKF